MASIIALTVTMTSSLIVQMIMITVIVKASKSRRRDAEPVTPVGHPLPARPGFQGPERSTGHLLTTNPAMSQSVSTVPAVVPSMHARCFL